MLINKIRLFSPENWYNLWDQVNIFKKISMIGKKLDIYSLDTVKMFYNDAQASKYKIM